MNIKILQWNCRSIDKNMDQLSQFLTSQPCHILCLQSLNVRHLNLPNIQGYFFPPIYSIDKKINRVSTAIYIRSDIAYTNFNPPINNTCENIIISAVKIKLDNSYYIIMSVYLPKGPNNSNTDWLKYLNDYKNTKYIITGDFNAHAPFWEKKLSDNNIQ